MNKQEFKEKYNWSHHPDFNGDLQSVITTAISEHEAGKWKKYPENVPDNSGFYIVTTGENNRVQLCFWNGYWEGDELNLITAFRELPEPYKPE